MNRSLVLRSSIYGYRARCLEIPGGSGIEGPFETALVHAMTRQAKRVQPRRPSAASRFLVAVGPEEAA